MIKNLLLCRNIQRMSGRFIHRSYDLTQHQWLVGMLFRHFALLDDVSHDINVWDIVLKHDIVETATMCDLIWPVKNLNEKTKEAWEVIEDEVLQINPQLERYSDKAMKEGMTSRQFALFKACDYLELLVFCKEEQAFGNQTKEIVEVIYNCECLIKKYCQEFNFVNLQKFVENYEL
jgi:5'-deoxynucleotidase YfbR-like HD superfamily hydrolase